MPAEFVRGLRLPGYGDHIRRPLSLFEDKTHGEVIVADAGRNRLVFFDREGTYRFEFDCADRIGSPIGVGVDSEGFVYVLGSSREGRLLLRYDFDGFFLSQLLLDDIVPFSIDAFSIDANDRLVLLDREGTLHVLDRSGTLLRSIDTASFLSSSGGEGTVYGPPKCSDGYVYVPVSSVGTVLVVDLTTGTLARTVGHAGNTPGQLNFPIAVDVLPSGIVAVLDKMRFAVVCYAPDGRFLGEFGGKGYRDGWFYHPTLMVATGSNEVIVGQIMDNRIQVLRVPEFIRSRLEQKSSERRRVGRSVEVGKGSGLGVEATSHRP